MKPRICLRHGIWSCVGKVPARDGWFILLMGHGYTPAEAYAEWKVDSRASQRGLMRRSKKPPRCKVCRERTEGLPLHEACVDEFVHIQREKKARKLEKAHREIRRKDRQRRAELKTIPDLIKEAQREFNAFIRARDQGKPCICCGKPLGEGDVGGGYDCGHYRSTGSAPHLRFDERNAAAQRKQCNRYGAGRAVDYRIGLIQRIGLAAVESLEADNAVHKWTREELIAIRDKYRTLVRQMKKDTE